MFSTKITTLISLFSLFAISFGSAVSQASDELIVSADCQKAAIRQTYIQLRRDSGWTADQANQVAYLHDPFHQEEDPENVVTVSVESTDIREWDGYAAYKVTIAKSVRGCEASQAVLQRADGF